MVDGGSGAGTGRVGHVSAPVIGAHVGSDDPLGRAQAVGADAIQLFLGNPQTWRKPTPRPDAKALASSKLPIYVHAPYLINLASPNNRIRIPSRQTLANAAEAAAAIAAKALVVHGGHVGADESPKVGFARWRKALSQRDFPLPILIENTAGGGNAVARRLDVIAGLWEEIGEFGVGFCLDTCHFWSAGEELAEVVDGVRTATGRLDLVHCNDSRDPFGSGRDRHTNLGEGEIPFELLVGVARAAATPVLVETPEEGQAQDIARLHQGLGQPA